MPSLERLWGVSGVEQARQVRVGTLWHEPSKIEHVLHRYCKHIFVLTGDDDFPYQFFGSGTAVRFGARHFVFCTGHQISRFNPDKVAIYVKSANATITASSLWAPTVTPENNDTDWIDVYAFEYDVTKYSLPNLSSEFFTVEENCIWPARERGHFILFGYVTERQNVDYETPHIAARVVEVGGTYVNASYSPYMHCLKMDRKEKFDADGMSGGPVFYIGGKPGSYFAGLAGLIIRGSKSSDFIHFIEAGFMKEMAAK